jgi:hypothetical protein
MKLSKRLIEAGECPIIVSPLTRTPTVELSEIIPILETLTKYITFEEPEDAHCIFCEDGGGWNDTENKIDDHNEDCIAFKAKEILTRLGIYE